MKTKNISIYILYIGIVIGIIGILPSLFININNIPTFIKLMPELSIVLMLISTWMITGE